MRDNVPFLRSCHIYQKKAKNRAKEKKEKKLMFLERDVIASYLSDLTRFQHRMKLHHRGTSLYMVARGFSLQKKRYKILKVERYRLLPTVVRKSALKRLNQQIRNATTAFLNQVLRGKFNYVEYEASAE